MVYQRKRHDDATAPEKARPVHMRKRRTGVASVYAERTDVLFQIKIAVSGRVIQLRLAVPSPTEVKSVSLLATGRKSPHAYVHSRLIAAGVVDEAKK